MNSLAGQVVNSIKAMQQQPQTQTQPVTGLINCLDSMAQSLPGVVQGANDCSTKIALPSGADIAGCNGSANILVFQQKAAPATMPSASSNVPVLVSLVCSDSTFLRVPTNLLTIRSMLHSKPNYKREP